MKLVIGVGLSGDGASAAREAVLSALKTVPRPMLALVYASIRLDQKAVHAELCRHLDPEIIIGCSSYVEMTNAGAARNSVAVLLLSMDGLRVSFASSESFEDGRRTGLALAQALPPFARDDGAQALLSLTALVAGREQELLGELNERLGGVPIAGGIACGDYDLGMSHPDFWTNYQYDGPRLATRASRLAALEFPAGCKIAFGYGHGWEAVGGDMLVTKAAGPDVYELDGVPVIDFYRQFLGRDAAGHFFEHMVQRYGFAMPASGGSKTAVKVPVAVDFEKGCIRYLPSEDMTGKKVRLLQSSRLGLISGARAAALECSAAMPGRRPDLVIMTSCCSRSLILHSRENAERDAVLSVFGEETPLVGFYSAGEFAPEFSGVRPKGTAGNSRYHVTTVALMAVYANQPCEASIPARFDAASLGERDPGRAQAMLERGEEFFDNTESFLSNLSRKSYRDAELLRRQHEMIHAYTPHGVWRQTDAIAQAGGQELSDAEFSGVFMFMDIKGFTTFSESHSSPEVVRALNEIFVPSTEMVYRHGGDVDKFIGDCIFASFPGPREAASAAKEILLLLRSLKEKGNAFTVRIGLNAGRAVRANVGSPSRREYTFIGDAVNTAQRLESNCEPGMALLSEDVYRAAGDLFAGSEERVIKLKGKAAPVKAFLCRV